MEMNGCAAVSGKHMIELKLPSSGIYDDLIDMFLALKFPGLRMPNREEQEAFKPHFFCLFKSIDPMMKIKIDDEPTFLIVDLINMETEMFPLTQIKSEVRRYKLRNHI